MLHDCVKETMTLAPLNKYVISHTSNVVCGIYSSLTFVNVASNGGLRSWMRGYLEI